MQCVLEERDISNNNHDICKIKKSQNQLSPFEISTKNKTFLIYKITMFNDYAVFTGSYFLSSQQFLIIIRPK